MIGHFLLQLTPEQEDRVLTGKMVAAGSLEPGGCVMQVACGQHDYAQPGALAGLWEWEGPSRHLRHVGYRYDFLCARFGTPRVNAAIRTRILSSRAQRVLSAPALVGCGAPGCS